MVTVEHSATSTSARLERRVTEEMRRVAARSTREVALRRGRSLGMYIGCGYPKSGTVWLCQLMSTYLGLPFPQKYQSPIAMASVIHAHWRYDRQLPPTVYIRRDGRDVMVSLYFYYMQVLTSPARPGRARELQTQLQQLYGDRFDPQSVEENLPRFLEWQFETSRGSVGLPWHKHVEDWRGRPGVIQARYESLLTDPVRELSAVMANLTGLLDVGMADLAVRRWSFEVSSGRKAGVEDRTSFLRKGVSGDWRSHFGREAGEVFDAAAGEALIELGYASDRSWWESL